MEQRKKLMPDTLVEVTFHSENGTDHTMITFDNEAELKKTAVILDADIYTVHHNKPAEIY